jgi:hypothetical protein
MQKPAVVRIDGRLYLIVASTNAVYATLIPVDADADVTDSLSDDVEEDYQSSMDPRVT